MVNWRNVFLIFQREVRDQLRDRRTLFMVAVLPLLLYPALGLGTLHLTSMFHEQPRTVVVLGAEHLPEHLPGQPELINGEHFARQWFSDQGGSGAQETAASKLIVITDRKNPSTSDAPRDPGQSPGQSPGRETGRDESGPDTVALLARAQAVRDALKTDVRRAGELFGTSGLQVVVIIPDDFGANVTKVQDQLTRAHEGAGIAVEYSRPQIVFNKADEKSQITYGWVTAVLDKWEEAIRDDWLKLAHLDLKLTQPVKPNLVDVALEEQMSASFWSKLFPALLIIMSVTGAFYPAIDLVAGEKERGTMETLLICPATRTEIVLGKFFTVMLFSGATALLNLASIGMTGKHVVGMSSASALARAPSLGFPPLSALAWILLLLIPLAALFSALCLALATFARSSKEGQYYLTPLLMVTLGLTMYCMSPTAELTPQFSVLPVVGVALLLKGLLLSPLNAGALYVYVAPVMITSLGYSALALWWAIDQFQREEVLFREGERFEVGLWMRHVLRDKEPLPSFSESAFCYVLIMLLQFFALGFLKDRLGASQADDPTLLLKLMLVQQLAIIACPALMMGLMLTSSVRETFRIRWPGWKMLGAGIVLAIGIHPLSAEILSRLGWFFGKLPAEFKKPMEAMSNHNLPLWFVVLALAAAPAFCEEVAFRGFILSGLARRSRAWLAIGLSSIAFGVMHMIPQQVFNTCLLGLVLGSLALRSNSLWPCVAFHFANNSLLLLLERFGVAWHDQFALDRFCAIEEGGLRYRWPTLLICIAVVSPILVWLVRPLLEQPAKITEDGPPGELLPDPGVTRHATTGKILVGNRD